MQRAEHSARKALCLLASVAALLASNVSARINVVSLPGRDSVQLTIYNSVNLTLVRETRMVTLRKGLNRLEFSWANTLIDPTSAELRALDHGDAIEVVDTSFPPGAVDTLEWHIQSEVEGAVGIEVRYFTSGIRWSADYVAEAGLNEQTMRLAGNVRVTNESGEDYENAQLRLVVGVIRLVEDITHLARRRRGFSESLLHEWNEADADLRQQAQRSLNRYYFGFEKQSKDQKEIIKEGLSEYFLYTVEGRDTIPAGWSKRLPSFNALDVPIVSFYRYEKEVWGEEVRRSYRFTNSAAAHLGIEPLPDGMVKAFHTIARDASYAFVGSASVKYIPINEQVDLELGSDPEVQVKPTLLEWAKTDLQFDRRGNVIGWTIRETWQINVQNSKPIGVAVDLRRTFGGDWEVQSPVPFETVDAKKIRFVLNLKPDEQRSLKYVSTTRHGTNARR